jgi:hypothetical protein
MKYLSKTTNRFSKCNSQFAFNGKLYREVLQETVEKVTPRKARTTSSIENLGRFPILDLSTERNLSLGELICRGVPVCPISGSADSLHVADRIDGNVDAGFIPALSGESRNQAGVNPAAMKTPLNREQSGIAVLFVGDKPEQNPPGPLCERGRDDWTSGALNQAGMNPAPTKTSGELNQAWINTAFTKTLGDFDHAWIAVSFSDDAIKPNNTVLGKTNHSDANWLNR